MCTLRPPPTKIATFFSFNSGPATMFSAFTLPQTLPSDTVGAVVPSGYASRNPDPDGDTAVIFKTTDVTPDDGTPLTPATCKVTVAPAATGPVVPPVPVRVSISRTGPAGKKAEPAAAE